MCDYQPELILCQLETQIRSSNHKPVDPMPGDVWLLTSAMQKAIRRGEIGRAISAATGLYNQDRDRFWKRLHIIALEDVGVSAADILIQTLTAVSASRWRRRVGDLRVGLELVRLLCGTVKTRMADELISQVEHAPAYRALRTQMTRMTDDDLADYVAEDHGLVERAMALRYLVGTRKYPSDVIPPRNGSPETAIEVLRSLGAPANLTESCIGVMGRSPWPLALYSPLIWLETAKRISGAKIRKNTLDHVGEASGLPHYATDLFTRVGQSSFRQLQKVVPELKNFSVRQIGLSVFYLEGCLIDRTWKSNWADEFKQAGEIADVEGCGMWLPEYMGLRECLARNWEQLTEIRHDLIRKSLAGGEL